MIPKVHPTFKLNGKSLDHNGLMTVAYSYVKEGELWEKQVGDFILNWLDDFDFHTVYTSGSTGTPKETRLDKQHMINSAQLTGERFNLAAESDVLCCLPLSYIAGKMMMVRAIHLGWHLDLVQPQREPLEHVEKRYDFTALTAYQAKHSIDYLYKSRKTIIGGGPVDDLLIKALNGRHTRAYHTYGMTETCTHVGIKELYPNKEDHFTTLPNIKVAASDDGCLIVHAPELASDPVHTNDLVEIIDEHSFKILGRADDVIITGGVKVHPDVVENKLSAIIDQRFFIAGLPDNDLGNEVVLIVEGQEQDYAFAKAKLDKYEKPRQVLFANKFTETHTGKIDKIAVLKSVTA
ncbi:AMP-binding protein [Nonlabens ponticola]|uniref:O-succinylbenzoic acid--CoA ligase n=1 Tax=Nonlabens ponticola TaxID=2496866 RepID=A0A3S9MY79_9FLAO|nr:AMP-binding protein [Nonlabens ponticola]AZQ44003.1 O-succinylbenzoic acid--CoA ligase [Nonlabens ponticola]